MNFFERNNEIKTVRPISHSNFLIRKIIFSDIIFIDYLKSMRWKIRKKSLMVFLYSFISSIITLIIVSFLYSHFDQGFPLHEIFYPYFQFLTIHTIQFQYF